jgi:glycosyltransferase involved in cell wall biosynthesis
MIMPAVSVIMPVFNGERWIAEAIQSVLEQTFADFELIIVNDGSSDASLEIINQFAEKDSRVRIFDEQNRGQSVARNYGVKQARGEWIACIDADDLWHPHRLEKQINLIYADKEIILVGTGLLIIDEFGFRGRSYNFPVKHKNLVKRLVDFRPFFAHSSAIYKKEIFDELGGYRDILKTAEDHDLWLRLSERGKIGCIRSILVSIRKHNNNISSSENGRRQMLDSIAVKISYWRRKWGYEDPLLLSEDLHISTFLKWIEKEIEDLGVIKDENYIKKLKRKIREKNSQHSKFMFLAMSFIYSPLIISRRLRYKIFGSKMAIFLAKKL